MNRIIFLVDGFNVYHSVVEASYYLGGASTKWLDIYSLCSSYLPLIAKDAKIERVYYFSALATHLQRSDPGKVARHQAYIECLRSKGIEEIMGRFKPREAFCHNCKHRFIRHEEKETDVAIATKLLEIFHNNECDSVVLMTGDTDLSPAIETAIKLFPNKNILCIFPFNRFNNELKSLLQSHFKKCCYIIKAKTYVKHQFPDPVTLPDGKRIAKPSTW
jgi:uncharacterized LabA/DUF88 family protein